MKAARLLTSLLLLSASSAFADDYSETLEQVVRENLAIKALQARTDADVRENHTGLNLANPEVELSYQWGSPDYVPDKKTIDVSQSFDFATLSGGKRRVALAKDKLAEISLALARRDIAAQADALMTEIVFRSRIAEHYDSALNLMNRTLEAAQLAFSKQEMTVVDVNSVKMELCALEAEAELNDIDLMALRENLSQLAGGRTINWTPSGYSDFSLPADFSAWCAENAPLAPEVMAARANVSLADKEISLRKSEGLPSFSLGYTSELVTDANYHGVTLGVELPLWANSGRVKAARAAKSAAECDARNAVLEFELAHRTLYQKALALRKLEASAIALRDQCDIRTPLLKLYSEGRITSHEYLAQLQPMLQLERRVIEAEFEYRKALADFRAASLR